MWNLEQAESAGETVDFTNQFVNKHLQEKDTGQSTTV